VGSQSQLDWEAVNLLKADLKRRLLDMLNEIECVVTNGKTSLAKAEEDIRVARTVIMRHYDGAVPLADFAKADLTWGQEDEERVRNAKMRAHELKVAILDAILGSLTEREGVIATCCAKLGLEPLYRIHLPEYDKDPDPYRWLRAVEVMIRNFDTEKEFEASIYYYGFELLIKARMLRFLDFLQTYVPPLTAELCSTKGEAPLPSRPACQELDAGTGAPRVFSPDTAADRLLTDREIKECLERITDDLTEGPLIGESPAMREVREKVEHIAEAVNRYDEQRKKPRTDDKQRENPPHVLIVGETGTGKEAFKDALIERLSHRRKDICTCNCATLSSDESAARSELFGHKRGGIHECSC